MADDADALGRVHVRAWQAAYGDVMPSDFLAGLRATDRAEMWRRQLIGPPSPRRLDVLVVDGELVGFAAYGPEATGAKGDELGELYAINLDPLVWGRGLGRTLLGHVTIALGSLGYRQAVLWVVAQNARACALYESCGWNADGPERHADVLGAAVEEVRYRYDLQR